MKNLIRFSLVATALLISSTFVGCAGQTLTSEYDDIRTIEITGGSKKYDSGLIDGFYNGEATATWAYYNTYRYYKYETENAETTYDFLHWSCTSTRYKPSAAYSWIYGSLSASGIVNYSGNDHISRIYNSANGENFY